MLYSCAYQYSCLCLCFLVKNYTLWSVCKNVYNKVGVIYIIQIQSKYSRSQILVWYIYLARFRKQKAMEQNYRSIGGMCRHQQEQVTYSYFLYFLRTTYSYFLKRPLICPHHFFFERGYVLIMVCRYFLFESLSLKKIV